jgi:3-hydroxyisobutyrate dehydrogenase
MAKNLAMKSTKPVYIYDINQKAIERLTSEFPQLKPAKDPQEIARQASTIITMLPETSHVEKVYADILNEVDTSHLLVDSSTIDAQAARELAKRFATKGTLFFDAPVSGGVGGAQAGTLTFMVGSPSTEAFEKIKPVLSWMGKNVTYCGASGAGQIAKVCNNMLLSIHMIGVSEALLLGTKLGMDPKLLTSILNTSTGKCWSSEVSNPYPGVIPTAPASRGYQDGFSNKLMAKDLRLAMKAASDCGVTPELGTMSSKVFQTLASDKEYDSLDFSSVFKVPKKYHCNTI